MPSRASRQSEARRSAVLAVLCGLALLSCLAFMTYGARGDWAFVLQFRGAKLLALCLVAYAVAVSTVLFQTITENRILTPSIMGFDALFGLLQAVLILLLGSRHVSGLDGRLLFALETATLVGFALLLYSLLLTRALRDLHLLLLVGVCLGMLFRSATGFLQRIVDPDEFVVLQDRLFASFNSVDTGLLAMATALALAASLLVWRIFPRLDVMALGRETAISLGVDHRRTALQVLAAVAVLVAVSTALVGPILFFGLLVANLAYLLLPGARHGTVLAAAVAIAIVVLVLGQTVLERWLGFETALAIVIEFAGGLVFLLLLLKGRAR